MVGIRLGFLVVVVLFIGLLVGCGGVGSWVFELLESFIVEEIYKCGEYELENSCKFVDVVCYFFEVEWFYFYLEWVKCVLIMQVYFYYCVKDYEEVCSVVQCFIDIYLGDEDVVYVKYLLVFSYYDQIDDVGCDQGLIFQVL